MFFLHKFIFFLSFFFIIISLLHFLPEWYTLPLANMFLQFSIPITNNFSLLVCAFFTHSFFNDEQMTLNFSLFRFSLWNFVNNFSGFFSQQLLLDFLTNCLIKGSSRGWGAFRFQARTLRSLRLGENKGSLFFLVGLEWCNGGSWQR